MAMEEIDEMSKLINFAFIVFHVQTRAVLLNLYHSADGITVEKAVKEFLHCSINSHLCVRGCV